MRWLLATLHLLGLGIGLGAIWARARALRGTLDPAGLRGVFYADMWWGVAAVIWLATGLVRLFGGLEKGAAYYLSNPLFHAKLGALGLILVLELWPMVTLIRWRVRLAHGEPIDTSRAGAFATISLVQAALVVLMVLAAVAVARGIGA